MRYYYLTEIAKGLTLQSGAAALGVCRRLLAPPPQLRQQVGRHAPSVTSPLQLWRILYNMYISEGRLKIIPHSLAVLYHNVGPFARLVAPRSSTCFGWDSAD